jgi:predicted membrane-bound spermidine synthase
MNFLKRNFLFLIVFITGATILIIEIAAFRIIAPYFGNTLFTTSSIIGVVLGGLSLGYYLGGWLADKYPKFSTFFLLIFIAGIFSFLIHFFSRTILPVLGYSLDIRWGPPIVSLILFFIPSSILGTMSPFAIKLKTLDLKEVGKISGRVFFWSTLGSIIGSFLAGFFLILYFGISKIIVFIGFLLTIIGLLGIYFSREREDKINFRKPKFFLFLIIVLIIVLSSFLDIIFLQKPKSVIFQKDGLYSQITIKEETAQDNKSRVLYLNRIRHSAIFLEPDELGSEYLKYYIIYEIINPEAEKVLFLGGGAYAAPRKLLLSQNNIKRVDVVEIEPMLYHLAKQYFRLQEDPRLFNHITDGRRFLKEANENYDLIFADVFSPDGLIPFHFTSREFFLLAKNKLSKNGLFLMNVMGTLEEKKNFLLLSEVKTFESVFKNSYLFAVNSPEKKELQNFILVGFKNDSQKIDFESKEVLENKNEVVRNLSKNLVNLESLDLNTFFIFTDDFAPIEYLTANAIY